MTAHHPPSREPKAANGSSLLFGPAGYERLLRLQIDTAIGLTAAWATAMSAMSGPARPAPAAAGETPGATTASPQLTVLSGEADATPAAGSAPTGRGWLNGAEEPRRPRMLDWLTGSPMPHPSLFDEAVVLLVDEDIKTAS